ncbi:MAG: ATP-binding cassette domain-containing protein, partial [Planctomycetota bacterium]
LEARRKTRTYWVHTGWLVALTLAYIVFWLQLWLYRDVVEWSAGEARRVLLARALVRPADLIVLDEPFDGVDPATAAQVAAALRMHRPQAILLVVDHRPEALHVADRVLTLANGRVVADRPVRSA